MALKKPSDFFVKKVVEDNNLSVLDTDDSLREELNKVESLSEQLQQLQQELTQKVVKNDLESLVFSQINLMQENFESLQTEFKQSNKSDLNKFKEVISEITNIVNHLVENEIPKYKKEILSNEVRLGNQLKEFKGEVEDKVQKFYQVLNEFNDVVQVIDSVSNIEKYLKEHHQDLITLREEVFTEIEQIPVGNLQENLERLEKKIDFIRETYSKIDPETVAKEIIQEGLLNEPSETKNEDPLTPLDQNFVTLDQLQEHYRLFINRIQQQLSTIGGGGETRLKYLDDIVGIATNASAYNGKFLKYDHSLGKFVFDDPATGGGGGGDYASVAGISTYATLSGISTYASVSGISTYSSLAGVSTYAQTAGVSTYASVAGIATYSTASGIATVAQGLIGTPNLDVGVVTATSFIGNLTGAASTAATVDVMNTNGLTNVFYPTFVEFREDGQILRGDVDFKYDCADNALTVSEFVGNLTGTATTATYLSDAANILTGTINKDRISTTNALTVLGDLYVSNNISFGGTTTQLNTEQLQIVDADIVLGIGTTFNSTDNTANHGGIAIASTEGTPLIDLNIVPGETNPSTYKKMMWFKGSSIGAGLTDAWLFNYAVGIGSTNVPNGVYLAAGNVQFTQNDLKSIRGINASGIVTASSFVPSSGYIKAPDGTNSFYMYSGTGNVAFQGTIGASKINNASGYNAIDFSTSATPNVLVPNGLIVTGVTTSGGFVGNLTGTATTATTAGYASTAGIATVAQGLTGTPNITVGVITATDYRVQSVSEKTTLVNGNTVSLVYNTGSGNIAICTNPSGDVSLSVTGIPTDSNFDNRSLTFSVIVNNTGTARSCTAVTLNGVSRTIKWFGGSLSAAISGVTTSSGYDIYNFTGINTVGSASTTTNYDVLGTVNGGYR